MKLPSWAWKLRIERLMEYFDSHQDIGVVPLISKFQKQSSVQLLYARHLSSLYSYRIAVENYQWENAGDPGHSVFQMVPYNSYFQKMKWRIVIIIIIICDRKWFFLFFIFKQSFSAKSKVKIRNISKIQSFYTKKFHIS